MTDIKSLEQEKNELNALINKGVSFEIDDWDFEIKKLLFGLIRKRIPVKVKRKFRIEEPTLGTLDRLSAEWIEFSIEESKMSGDDKMKKTKSLVANNTYRLARIVAIAVIGSDYLMPKYTSSNVVRYVENTHELRRLTNLFLRTIKPSKLHQLAVLIDLMCNFGDFMNSIRLMSADRTAMPIRVEEKHED